MLGLFMTRATKRDQVGQFIGLFIVVILIWDIAELSKGTNMMHVQEGRTFLVLMSTSATHVIVALARQFALLFPIGAIIIDFPAFPRRVLWPQLILGSPLATTFRVAVIHFCSLKSVVRNKYGLAAFGTNCFHAIPKRGILSSIMQALTFTATKPSFVFARRPNLEFFTAMNTDAFVISNFEFARALKGAAFCGIGAITLYLKMLSANAAIFLDWIVVVGLLALQGFPIAKVRAKLSVRTTTCNKAFSALLARSFESLLSGCFLAFARAKLAFANIAGGVFNAAVFTLKNGVLGHNKSLLTKGYSDSSVGGEGSVSESNFSRWFMRPSLSLLYYNTGGA